jgi:uncharacterized protein YjbI with pentapeptide repeats
MTRAQLHSATLIDCDFGGACLIRSDLRAALVVKTDLQRALLRDAQVEQTTLIHCGTMGAELPAALVAGTAASRPVG